MSLREYLTSMAEAMASLHQANKQPTAGWKYQSMEALVLAEGTEYGPTTFTEEELEALRPLMSWGPFEAKACYRNAQDLALNFPMKVVYCEGFGEGKVIPAAHGWVLFHDKVVDTTWGPDISAPEHNKERDMDRLLERVQYNAANGTYMGITFGTEEVRSQVLGTKQWESMIDRWEDGHPLLKNGVRHEQ